MTPLDDEVPLSGGNINTCVVRVGDTVRRSLSSHSESVHRLLMHLEQKGFSHAPRFLGIDEQGREVTSYIEGDAEFPKTLWSNRAVIIEAGKMLRSYHEAVQDFDYGQPEDWAYAYPIPEHREVIGHNDFAPYNMLFREGLPVAIVDFDLAGPVPRLRDLAYLAYWLTPLSFVSGDLRENSLRETEAGCPRFRLLCETYGTTDYTGLLAMVSHVLAHMSDEQIAIQMVGAEAAARLKEGGHFDHWKQEVEGFEQYRDSILSCLTRG